MSKNVLITGINKGLGKELFELFLTKGYTVYGLLRNPLVAEKLKSNLPENGKLIEEKGITELGKELTEW